MDLENHSSFLNDAPTRNMNPKKLLTFIPLAGGRSSHRLAPPAASCPLMLSVLCLHLEANGCLNKFLIFKY